MSGEMMEEAAIGIDLGTTNSCASWVDMNIGRPVVLKNLEGAETTPSVVYFKDDEVLVGAIANKTGRLKFPERTVYEAKRMLGLKYQDEKFQSIQDRMPHNRFCADEHGRVKIVVERKGMRELYSPEQISALVLARIKEYASAALHKRITAAVITVPAYFNEQQRAATKDAADIAGLRVLKLLNEPTAAAIAYGFHRETDRPIYVLVYDFGGGTLDVTLMRVEQCRFQAIATTGDAQLGGQDLDEMLLRHCLEAIKQQHDPSGTNAELRRKVDAHHKLRQRLMHQVENLKKNLSQVEENDIALDAAFNGEDFELLVTRTDFEYICAPLFERCLTPVRDCLRYAQLSPGQVDEVVLAGGSSRIPKVQEMLRQFFGKDVRRNLDADTAIAMGAAIIAQQAASVATQTMRPTPMPMFGSRPQAAPYAPPVPAPGARPGPFAAAYNGQNRPAAPTQPMTVVQPDDAYSVAQKAAMQRIASGRVHISDVVPMPIGLRTQEEIRVKRGMFGREEVTYNDRVFTEMIAAQRAFPVLFSKSYSTSMDHQREITFEVYQGFGKSIDENLLIGRFVIDNLEPKPRGAIVFDVTFKIDENGCLSVNAQQRGNNRVGHQLTGIQLNSSDAWAPAEIQNMRNQVASALQRHSGSRPSSLH